MPQIVRFGVSMDAELLAAFDALVTAKGYPNRSEALRDMVREAIVHRDWHQGAAPAVAALCIVYDHHAGDLPRRLARLQHEHTREITATLHVHLDERNCLEVIVLKGSPAKLQRLADRVISTRGVKHGKLVITTTGKHGDRPVPEPYRKLTTMLQKGVEAGSALVRAGEMFRLKLRIAASRSVNSGPGRGPVDQPAGDREPARDQEGLPCGSPALGPGGRSSCPDVFGALMPCHGRSVRGGSTACQPPGAPAARPAGTGRHERACAKSLCPPEISWCLQP